MAESAPDVRRPKVAADGVLQAGPDEELLGELRRWGWRRRRRLAPVLRKRRWRPDHFRRRRNRHGEGTGVLRLRELHLPRSRIGELHARPGLDGAGMLRILSHPLEQIGRVEASVPARSRRVDQGPLDSTYGR